MAGVVWPVWCGRDGAVRWACYGEVVWCGWSGGAGEVWWDWCGVWSKCSGAGVVWWADVLLELVWCGVAGVVW